MLGVITAVLLVLVTTMAVYVVWLRRHYKYPPSSAAAEQKQESDDPPYYNVGFPLSHMQGQAGDAGTDSNPADGVYDLPRVCTA